MIPLVKPADQCMKPEVSSLQLSSETVKPLPGFKGTREQREQEHLFQWNTGYCQLIFREQGNFWLDFWEQRNTNVLSIMVSSITNRR